MTNWIVEVQSEMIVDELNALFPEGSHSKFLLDDLEVEEKEVQATLKKVIWKNFAGQVCDTELVKGMTSFFQKYESARIFYMDCDGILIFERKDGRKTLVLCELKSNYDTTKIYKAYQQILSSCIKFKLLLNLLPSCRAEEWDVKGFIFSKPKLNKDKLLRDLSKQSQLSRDDDNRKVAELAMKLWDKSSMPLGITPGECREVNELPLGERVLFPLLQLYHIEVDSQSNTCEVDARQYIWP